MKNTDFAIFLNKYFTIYLPNIKGCTPATIDSYRYTFILFLLFMKENKNLTADKIKVIDLSYNTIISFLNWIQNEQSNSVSTRNQRQAAINSFVRYLMYEIPEYLSEYQKIISIPIKKVLQKEISYIKTNGVKFLLEQVNMDSKSGLRDYTILMLLYSTGIRVSELINIRIKDVSLQKPATLLVHGKGQKSRYVPLLKNTIKPLQNYINSLGYDQENDLNKWLFQNYMKEHFTRQGINYIVKKYVIKSRKKDVSIIPEDFSPHKMRHTTAMELVDSGVDLIYIRDLLGHVSIKTTEIYAKADSAKKRSAIEAVSKEFVPTEEAQWESNVTLKDWLKKFNRI
jgi:site-specific recombinase XerD